MKASAHTCSFCKYGRTPLADDDDIYPTTGRWQLGQLQCSDKRCRVAITNPWRGLTAFQNALPERRQRGMTPDLKPKAKSKLWAQPLCVLLGLELVVMFCYLPFKLCSTPRWRTREDRITAPARMLTYPCPLFPLLRAIPSPVILVSSHTVPSHSCIQCILSPSSSCPTFPSNYVSLLLFIELDRYFTTLSWLQYGFRTILLRVSRN